MNEDELRRRLRVSAEDFEPDSDRMWDRVSAGLSQPDMVTARPIRGRFRVPHLALATGVAMVLIAAIVVIGYKPVFQSSPPVGPPSGTTSPQPTDSPWVVPELPKSVDELDAVDATAEIFPDGNDYWSESTIVLTTDERLSDITVEMHVVMRDDVRSTGSWTTAAQYFGQPDIVQEDGYLVFRWKLQPGVEVEPKQYSISAQFNQDWGYRDSSGDYFVVKATSDSGEGKIVGGVSDPDED